MNDDVEDDLDWNEDTDEDVGAPHSRPAFSEQHFGLHALPMAKLGWAVIPQKEDRSPVRVDREALKWSAYTDVGPDVETIRRWIPQAFSYNLAIILGRASNGVFGIDVDVTDPMLAEKIRFAIFKHLGRTNFQRIGDRPKAMYFFRMVDGEDLPPYRRFVLLEENRIDPTDHAIEILGQSRIVTAYGRHHQTGREFVWDGLANPVSFGPDSVTAVTGEQIEAFVDEVEASIRGFHRNGTFVGGDIETYTRHEGEQVTMPTLRSFEGSSAWTEDPRTGLVTDGRDAFLFRMCMQVVRANPEKCRTPEGQSSMIRATAEAFLQRIAPKSKWNERYVLEETRSKISRLAQKMNNSELQPAYVDARPSTRRTSVIRTKDADVDETLSFLARAARATRTGRNKLDFEYLDEGDETRAKLKADRALQPDRTQIAAKISGELSDSIGAFLDHVYSRGDGGPEVFIIKAPTGAGKTTRTARMIAEDPRTTTWKPEAAPVDDEGNENTEGPGPFLMLLPTYNNISELRERAEVLNLDVKDVNGKPLTDAELYEVAKSKGLVHSDDMERVVNDLRRDAMNAGLRTMIYKGKKAANCRVSDKLDVLMESGVSTSGLCKAKVRRDDEFVDDFCPFYHECEAIQQRKEIAESHVVFAPHAFFSMQIPVELKNVRAVIADESTFHLFVHTASFDLNSLTTPRKPPRLTKKERESGAVAEQFLDDRDLAAKIAREALVRFQCPANALMDVREVHAGKVQTGLDLVRSAIRVCGNAISSDQTVTPTMSLADLQALCAKPTGKDVAEEFRFWKIVEERMEALGGHALHVALAGGDRSHPASGVTAKGDKDYRIQRVIVRDDSDEANLRVRVRISWRSEPNWLDKPTLLLDASAHPKIARKVFGGGGRRVVECDMNAPLNVKTVAVIDRTYSNASVMAKSGTREDRRNAANVKLNVRKAIALASSVFGYGRVVAGASTLVRRGINHAWKGPENVDWTHFGAMRGLDFGKNHVCAISVGRMELPTGTIDGLVAALTYDDDQPEAPFDLNGDGRGPDGGNLRVPMVKHRLEMRDGRDVLIEVPRYPGEWAAIIQQQYREEELRQFVGRLRPVYRAGDAPVWIAISRVIPDGVIVDDIIGLADLVRPGGKSIDIFEGVRRSGGVLHPEICHATSPHLRTDKDAWAAEIGRLGFRPDGLVLDRSKRWTWGFRAVSIRRETGETDTVFVRTTATGDPAEVVPEAFERWLEESVEVLEIGSPCHDAVIGTPRVPDKVDLAIGTLEQREIEEARIESDAMLSMVWNTETQSYEHMAQSMRASVPVAVRGLPRLDGKSDILSVESQVAQLSSEDLIRNDRDIAAAAAAAKNAATMIHLGLAPADDTAAFDDRL